MNVAIGTRRDSKGAVEGGGGLVGHESGHPGPSCCGGLGGNERRSHLIDVVGDDLSDQPIEAEASRSGAP